MRAPLLHPLNHLNDYHKVMAEKNHARANPFFFIALTGTMHYNISVSFYMNIRL